jgi:hypothetical protein
MTPTPAPVLDQLVLRSPDALVAAVPYLLGFHPRESSVVVWLQGGRIVLTQRLDLPVRADDHEAWLAAMWQHVVPEAAEELILVFASGRPVDGDLLSLVTERAALAGIEVRDVLRMSARRWWSLLCRDDRCCPPEGREIDPATASSVAAEFAVIGRAPLADRDELERAFRPDQVKGALVAAVLAASPELPAGAAREPWRDERIASILRTVADDAAAPERRAERVADLLNGLRDVRVRDTVLWEVSRWDAERLHGALDQLSLAVRSAPPGFAAPVASCAAIVAWLLGDGARALIAVERSHDDDRGYSLALLVAASLRAGLPPSAWLESMAGLTREACRHGSDAPESVAS